NGTFILGIRQPEIFYGIYPPEPGKVRQMAFLARSFTELFKYIGTAPDIVRLNEPQLFFTLAAVENDISFFEGKRKKSIYKNTRFILTTHTPEAAALPVYSDVAWLKHHIGEDLVPDWSIRDGRLDLARRLAEHEKVKVIFAVSQEHDEVTKLAILPEFKDKTLGITNGSDPQIWKSPELTQLERKDYAVSGKQLFDIGQTVKERLNSFLLKETGSNFADINRPLAGLVRRFVEYKEQAILFPILAFITGDRDKKYPTPWGEDYGLGMNLLVGGVGRDDCGRQWVDTFKWLAQQPDLAGKFIFVSGSDVDLMQISTQSSDVWVSMPRSTREACGTSDNRAAFNGHLNIATKTGGAREYIITGVNGWLMDIFDNSAYSFQDIVYNFQLPDQYEDKIKIVNYYRTKATELLARYLQEASRLYYSHTEGKDTQWLGMMENSYRISHEKMSIVRMVDEYAELFEFVRGKSKMDFRALAEHFRCLATFNRCDPSRLNESYKPAGKLILDGDPDPELELKCPDEQHSSSPVGSLVNTYTSSSPAGSNNLGILERLVVSRGPVKIVHFRGGRGASEITGKLAQLAEKGLVEVTIIPGAVDDGRSWADFAYYLGASGIPDIGKSICDLGADRKIADFLSARLLTGKRDLERIPGNDLFRVIRRDKQEEVLSHLRAFFEIVDAERQRGHKLDVRSIALRSAVLVGMKAALITWQGAINRLAELIDARGRVIIPTEDRLFVMAILQDGTFLPTENSINETRKESDYHFFALGPRSFASPDILDNIFAHAFGRYPDETQKKMLHKLRTADYSRLEGVSLDKIGKDKLADTIRYIRRFYACRGDEVMVSREALRSIKNADILLYGPTDIESNIASEIIIPRIRRAIEKSSAAKILISNAADEHGVEPPGTTTSTQAIRLFRYLSNQQPYQKKEADFYKMHRFIQYVIGSLERVISNNRRTTIRFDFPEIAQAGFVPIRIASADDSKYDPAAVVGTVLDLFLADKIASSPVKTEEAGQTIGEFLLSYYRGKIKAVIFDFDGIIARSMEIIEAAYTGVFFEIYKDINGLSPANYELAKLVSLSSKIFHEHIGMPTRDTLMETIHILQEEHKAISLRLGLSAQANNLRSIEEYGDSYIHKTLQLITSRDPESLLMEGADEVIKELNAAGILLYIASAGNLVRVELLKEKTLAALSLSDNFKKIIFTGSVDKKIGAIFEILQELKNQGIGSQEVLFVDDSTEFIEKLHRTKKIPALPIAQLLPEQGDGPGQAPSRRAVVIRQLSDLLAVLPRHEKSGLPVPSELVDSSSPIEGSGKKLTEKQVKLLELYAAGNNRKGICALLDININVVQGQLQSISRKLTGQSYKKNSINVLLIEAYKQHYFDFNEEAKRAVEALLNRKISLTAAELELARAYTLYKDNKDVICKVLGIRNQALIDRLMGIRKKLREAVGAGEWKISEILSELRRQGYDLNPGPEYRGLRDEKAVQAIYVVRSEELKAEGLTLGEVNALRSLVRIKYNKEARLGTLRSQLSVIRKKLRVSAKDGLSALIRKAVALGYDLTGNGITPEIIERVIRELKEEEINPLNPSQVRFLEIAQEIGLEDNSRIEYAELAKRLGVSSNSVEGSLKLIKANLGIKESRSEGSILARCVIVAADKGYIKSSPDALAKLRLKFETKTLTPYQKKILIMCALGLKPAGNKNLNKLYSDIRRAMGLIRQHKTLGEVVKISLGMKKLSETDIIDTVMGLDEQSRLSSVQFALDKGYLECIEYLFIQFRKNGSNLSAEEFGLLSGTGPSISEPQFELLRKSILLKLNGNNLFSFEQVKMLYGIYQQIYRQDNGPAIRQDNNSTRRGRRKSFESKWEEKYNNPRLIPDLKARECSGLGNEEASLMSLYNGYRWPTREEEEVLGRECSSGNLAAREMLVIVGMKIMIFRIQRMLKAQYKQYCGSYDRMLDNIFYTDRSILDFSKMREVVVLYDPSKGFRLSTFLEAWLPDASIRNLIADEIEAIHVEGLSIEKPLGEDEEGFTLLDVLPDGLAEDPLGRLEKKDIIRHIIAKYREYRSNDMGKAEDLYLAVLNLTMGQYSGKTDYIRKALRDEGFEKWNISNQGIRQRVENGKPILARILKEKGIIMPRREDDNAFASPSVAGGEQRFLPGGELSSSPVSRPKLTGQESLIFKEAVAEALTGEFKGLFDRVVRNIADKFIITLSRERVRNALSDVRRKFGIRIDKTSVKGTRSTISGLSDLILKAQKMNFDEVKNITQQDIDKIRAKETNPLNDEAKKILVFVLQGKSLEEIAKTMGFPNVTYIYRRSFYSVYGKLPEEAKGKKDAWRHGQTINAAKYALGQGWITAEDVSGAERVISNPLSRRERSILETAVYKMINTTRQVAEELKLKTHTIQVFVDEIADKLNIAKDGRNTLGECVKAGYGKGYINCSQDSYEAFILRFDNALKFNKAEAGALVYSALGFRPQEIALKLRIGRRYITTNIYGSIRIKLGIKLNPGQKTAHIMDEIIIAALKQRAIFESDIVSAIYEQKKELRLGIIERILTKGYFEVYNGVLKKLVKKLSEEKHEIKNNPSVDMEASIVEAPSADDQKTSLENNVSQDSLEYEKPLDMGYPEFFKDEDGDIEAETLRSYSSFAYPARQEQKALIEAIRAGKNSNADARVKARAKQAQDKLIIGTMQYI
ncbi:MAG: YvcK family protein, partial [Candidatus Omnitrophica bacterium]|nr:YvcK family protein [Candidatus Omnitrophota bacterium]